jgi:hypothetical protein
MRGGAVDQKGQKPQKDQDEPGDSQHGRWLLWPGG